MKIKLFTTMALLAVTLATPALAEGQFTAHEWGTFTSVQGADGVQLAWTPSIKTDLPGFVYSREIANGGFRGTPLIDPFGKGLMPGPVRMETPVIYFYSDAERTVDVRVQFPMGRITEWYPQATRVGPYTTTNKAELAQAGRSLIEWTGVKILPRNTREISAEKLIRENNSQTAEHYYAARETDANLLRMTSPHARTGAEYERDLFYRGVGYFSAPLTVKLDSSESELSLSTASKEPLTDLFVLTIQQGQARYQTIEAVTAKKGRAVKLETKPFAPLSDVRAKLMHDMAAALTRQGLYAKEAEAMVSTWKDQWFTEEGTRVLYLLPRKWTDQTLPLEISPKPDRIARVMVGRAEVITPTMERALFRQVVGYNIGDAVAKQQAVAEVRKLGLGRFLEPATRKILGANPPEDAFSKAAWELVSAVTKPAGQGPTVVDKQPAPARPDTAFVPNLFGVPN